MRQPDDPTPFDDEQSDPLLLALAGALFTASSVHAQDVAAGERKAAMCIGCHGIVGYQASSQRSTRCPRSRGRAPNISSLRLRLQEG